MPIAFVDGSVFIGNGRVLDNATVVVEGEHIVKVAAGEVALSQGFRKIPLDGRMLLPGFIDCHVHFCYDASAYPSKVLMSESLPVTTLKAARHARQTLMAGVTTVRDMGGKDGIECVIRDAIRAGLIPGPRMLASGRVICITGGQSWQFGREADGPVEVMKAAREQIKAGADWVKFMATGGVLTPGVEPGSVQFNEDELRAGIREAQKAGKKTASHAQGRQGILNALRAGIDSIEHGIFLDEEIVSLIVKAKVALVATLSAPHNILSKGVEAGIPAFAVDKARRVKPFHFASIRLAREAGVRIAMGTDAGTPFNRHGENLGELKRLVEVGFSPAEALQAGTSIAAELLGLEKDLGTIEEGKLADLIVVAGNPVENVEVLLAGEAVQLVMQGGRLVRGQNSDP